jgi:hypothetical protein
MGKVSSCHRGVPGHDWPVVMYHGSPLTVLHVDMQYCLHGHSTLCRPETPYLLIRMDV